MPIAIGPMLAVALAVVAAFWCGYLIGVHCENTRITDHDKYGDDQPGRGWR